MNHSGTDIILLSLGSNIGQRRAHMAAGIEALKNLPGVDVVAVSRLYETEAWGGPAGQRSFLNGALTVTSKILGPEEFLENILGIEAAQGRVRQEVNGPRTLDIDILLWGDTIHRSETLQIPHVASHERSFVLQPAAEVAPDMVHPVLGRSMMELSVQVGIQGLIRIIPERGWYHALGQSTCQ